MSFKKNQGALARVLSFISGRGLKKRFLALDDVSLRAGIRENVGIIGRNGSGKSTLLRIIAKIYTFDSGFVKTNGKVVYLTGFGQGLRPKLTMRENIFLIGAIMGLTNKEIKNRFNEVVEFSGLRNYVNTKVYQFSSGMISRLSFSITMHCVAHQNPDVLLVDEAFSIGGDMDFKNNSLKKMEDLIKGGATVVFVSHDMDLIEKYCDKVIWLEKGKIIKQGNPKEVINAYLSGDKLKNLK